MQKEQFQTGGKSSLEKERLQPHIYGRSKAGTVPLPVCVGQFSDCVLPNGHPLRDREHRPNSKVTYHSEPAYEDFRRSTAQNQHHATFNKKNQRMSPVMRLLTEADFAKLIACGGYRPFRRMRGSLCARAGA
jgi:hypothetical protein